jgi:hypothetical protein
VNTVRLQLLFLLLLLLLLPSALLHVEIRTDRFEVQTERELLSWEGKENEKGDQE